VRRQDEARAAAVEALDAQLVELGIDGDAAVCPLELLANSWDAAYDRGRGNVADGLTRHLDHERELEALVHRAYELRDGDADEFRVACEAVVEHGRRRPLAELEEIELERLRGPMPEPVAREAIALLERALGELYARFPARTSVGD
jgi:hypothetical protein